MRILLAVVLAGCGTTTSNVRLLHDLQIRGNELEIEECELVWTVDHSELPAALFNGPSRDERLAVGVCSPRSETFPGGGEP